MNLLNLKTAVLVTAVFIFIGCATYQTFVDQSRRHLKNAEYDQALQKLKPLAEKTNDDQLVYLFDYGTTLQISGQYEESNKILLAADKMVDIKDYHSVSRIAGSLALNQGMIQYKGEDYEKVIVNAMLAINFLALRKPDEALVETKRINEKLDYYIREGKKNYQQNEFAYYLAGMIWETNRQWDSAFIDYSKVLKLRPDLEFVKQDLYRVASLGRRQADLEKLSAQQVQMTKDSSWKNPNFGELILIFQQGWSPRKMPNPEEPRLPKLYPVSSFTKAARLVINDIQDQPSKLIYNLEAVAIRNLQDEYGDLVAQRMAGIATKAVISNQFRQKNEALGNLAWVTMNLMDQADLRQWSTLPETFQVSRKFLKGGRYKIRLEGLTNTMESSGEVSQEFEVDIRPRQKTFITWRSLN